MDPASRRSKHGKLTTTGRLAPVTGPLVVEDDETIGGALTDSMRAHGHDVTWSCTGAQALGEAGPFDLVLLDLDE